MASETLTRTAPSGIGSAVHQQVAELLVTEFGDEAPVYARRIVHALSSGHDAPAIALWCMALARLGYQAEATAELERFDGVLQSSRRKLGPT